MIKQEGSKRKEKKVKKGKERRPGVDSKKHETGKGEK